MPTKTNQQILDEYNSKGALSKVGIAARDVASIAGNALSLGLANRFAQAVTGATDEQRIAMEREQRVRAGLVGDVVKTAGYLYGGGAALKGVGKAYQAVKAAPTAVALARTAGPGTAARFITNRAGPGIVPVAAPISRKALAKGVAKGAGALGVLGLMASERMDDTPSAAAAAPETVKTAVDEALAVDGGEAQITTQDRAMSAIDDILSRPHTLREFQAATGALPGVASVATKQSNKDKVFGAVSGISDVLYQAELEQASKLTGDARDQAILKATENYRRNLLDTLGVDPSKQVLAALMQQAGEGE